MSSIKSAFISLFFLVIFGHTAYASQTPLVSIEWLHDHLTDDKLVLIDLQPQPYFEKVHIPGSRQSNYDDWRPQNAEGLGKMLPAANKLEKLIQKLGITQESHVVVVPLGMQAGDLAVATRVYWSLYMAGLNKLSILDGGLLAYYKKYTIDALETGPTNVTPSAIKISTREGHAPTAKDVEVAFNNGQTIVDTRSPEEFKGLVSGGPKERPGAIPKSLNLPYDSLTMGSPRVFLPIDQLKSAFNEAKISLTEPHISYCHTGHRTSLFWFVAHELLGNKEARMYDGSMLEWASTSDLPLAIK